jgi:hypothetical protein
LVTKSLPGSDIWSRPDNRAKAHLSHDRCFGPPCRLIDGRMGRAAFLSYVRSPAPLAYPARLDCLGRSEDWIMEIVQSATRKLAPPPP